MRCRPLVRRYSVEDVRLCKDVHRRTNLNSAELNNQSVSKMIRLLARPRTIASQGPGFLMMSTACTRAAIVVAMETKNADTRRNRRCGLRCTLRMIHSGEKIKVKSEITVAIRSRQSQFDEEYSHERGFTYDLSVGNCISQDAQASLLLLPLRAGDFAYPEDLDHEKYPLKYEKARETCGKLVTESRR